MGNLFGTVDLKVCKSCGEEKPRLSFPVKQKIGNRVKYFPYCQSCCGKARWAAVSEEAKARKRERDRQYIAMGKAKERMRKARVAHTERERQRRIADNIGAFCIVQWHKCEKCGRVKYVKNKEVLDKRCKRCARTKYANGPLPIKPVECPVCGEAHEAKVANARCAKCAKEMALKAKKAARRRLGGRLRSSLDRARKHGVYIETVKPSIVYKRDRHTCYLCGDKVIKSKTYHPKQATIDHVIPLAKGGPHTYDNVRCCCHTCNSLKSNSMPESYKSKGVQLSLFTTAAQRQ